MAQGESRVSAPRVLTMLPPNFRAINDAFNVRGKAVFYAYGGVIYNPSRTTIPPAIMAHEAVHLDQQAALHGGPAEWWDRYIDEPAFRLAQEIPAHRVEYQFLCANGGHADTALLRIAERLASPLYGSLIGIDEAKRLIGHAAEEGAPGHALRQ